MLRQSQQMLVPINQYGETGRAVFHVVPDEFAEVQLQQLRLAAQVKNDAEEQRVAT